MSRQRMWLLGLIVALASATVFCRADEPKKDAGNPKEMTAAQKKAMLADLALAEEMADVGRRAGSPEALLAAAKILSKLNGEGYKVVKLEGVKPLEGKVGDKPTTAGEPIKEEGGKEQDFSDRIRKLKAEAHKLNASPKDEKLDELIDKVADKPHDKLRGSLAGPRELGPFDIAPGATRTFWFRFIGGEPASVYVTNEGRGQLKMEIYNERGGQVISVTGAGELTCDWTPGMTRPFAVYVSNVGRQPRTFTLYKN
jgi:hypothetical protein